jgi:hypothetical protein
MSPEVVSALACDFWDRVGWPTFPCDLEGVLLLATPVWPVRLAGLAPGAVRQWLRSRRIDLPLDIPERPLDGCIVAYRDHAVIFVEAALPADEARLILAHEFAHYLADYERPRLRAVRRLGPTLLPVLDGARGASVPERLAAALADVSLQVHVHYMDRSEGPRLVATRRVEAAANALACELLAPRRVVRSAASRAGSNDWRRLLVEVFGLPPRWAAIHGARLARDKRRRRTFTDLLGW